MTLAALIEEYAAGAEIPRHAIAGLSAAELDAHPIPGTWSIREIVLHLMDSDLIASDRMKRIIAEKNPLLIGYDQDAFAARLHYPALDARLAAEAFRISRVLTTEILRRLTPEDFERCGVHNERGKLTLAEMVQSYITHLKHHVQFVSKKRELLGKPL